MVQAGIWIDRWGNSRHLSHMTDDHLLNARDSCARQAEIAWTHGDEWHAKLNEAMWVRLNQEWEERCNVR